VTFIGQTGKNEGERETPPAFVMKRLRRPMAGRR
jgi:hypothetical protein